MMATRRTQRDPYRKNYLLVFAFAVVLTVSLVVAIILAFTLVTSKVESDFASLKNEVVEHNLAEFNDFFQNKIPEISFYQGYLDSATASTYADAVLRRYPFVKQIHFFDILLNSNIETQYGFSANNLVIYPTGIYEFSLEDAARNAESEQPVLTHRRMQHASFILDDFHQMAFKLSSFLERVDTTQVVYGDELFRVFLFCQSGQDILYESPEIR